MNKNNLIALIGLSVLLPCQFSCTQSTGTVNSPPIEDNASALTKSESVVSDDLGMVRPMHIASANKDGVVTCGVGQVGSSDHNE